MIDGLLLKNDFVLALRDYLCSKYVTQHYFTSGEGDYEGCKIDDFYTLTRRNINDARDLGGFAFRKDLCMWPPDDANKLLSDVKVFAETYKTIDKLVSKNNSLDMSFKDKRYLVTSYIDGGYAGELSVSFIEFPFLI